MVYSTLYVGESPLLQPLFQKSEHVRWKAAFVLYDSVNEIAICDSTNAAH
jgi:hypothetical protein